MHRTAVVSTITTLALIAPVADAASWCACSGVLPYDPSLPEGARYTLLDEESFVTMNNGTLEIDDTVDPLRVVILKDDITFPTDGEWVYETEVRMISHLRAALDFGTQFGILDGERSVNLAIATDRIGFIEPGQVEWLEGLTVQMDTTDAPHSYRVVKTGAGPAAMIDLHIDDNPVPALSIPHEHFTSTATHQVLLTATSIIGTARYDVLSFAFNEDGAELIPCDADFDGNGAVDLADLLTLLGGWGTSNASLDLDNSGFVDLPDLLALLGGWGACP